MTVANRIADAVRRLDPRRPGRGPAWMAAAAGPASPGLPPRPERVTAIDLEPRRRQLAARVAELQWDLGGLAYEMAIRDRIRVDVLVQRAAALQEADAELGELERVLRMEQAGAAGACPACEALHSRGAAYCWQCGHALVAHVPSQAIAGRPGA